MGRSRQAGAFQQEDATWAAWLNRKPTRISGAKQKNAPTSCAGQTTNYTRRNRMSIYKKLQQARVKLQAMPLKKSGNNKFAGYQYFELGDFLPQSIEIFNEMGLCDVISFTADTATMRIIDIETDREIVITSPMGSAALKGCHEVQNVGAVETYQRRYLWVTAMGIVEHDAIDATTSNEAPAKRTAFDYEAAKRLIAGASSLETLKSAYTSLMKHANAEQQAVLTDAKDARKAQLTTKEAA
jgi:hypothetical protein